MRIILSIALLAAAALAAPEREITDCEICGGTVYQTPKTYVSGRTKYIYIDEPPHKPYCTRCQRDVNNGKIDPNDPPLLSPRDDEPAEEKDNPYARNTDGTHDKRKPMLDEESKSGFGVLPWAVGMLAAAGLVIRFFLRG